MDRVAACCRVAALAAAVLPSLLSFAGADSSAPDLLKLSLKTILKDRSALPPAPDVPAAGAARNIEKLPGVEVGTSDAGITSGRFTVAPNWGLTPGVLCTRHDQDFEEYRYAERVPYCRRNTTTSDKKLVSEWYGVPWEEHVKYQYDHLISLCVGGSNNLKNIWPMEHDEARKKAGMESRLCDRLRKGEITQKAAVNEELGWFSENAPHLLKKILSAQR